MEFVRVDEENLLEAGAVHAASWRESHRAVCSADFVAEHTPQRQAEYLRREMAAGKQVFMLVDEEIVGVVSIQGSLIENLYVHPSFWRCGYGSALLMHAQSHCIGTPSLWILSSNTPAKRLYEKHGYLPTGRVKLLSDTLFEIEMQKKNR